MYSFIKMRLLSFWTTFHTSYGIETFDLFHEGLASCFWCPTFRLAFYLDEVGFTCSFVLDNCLISLSSENFIKQLLKVRHDRSNVNWIRKTSRFWIDDILRIKKFNGNNDRHSIYQLMSSIQMVGCQPNKTAYMNTRKYENNEIYNCNESEIKVSERTGLILIE